MQNFKKTTKMKTLNFNRLLILLTSLFIISCSKNSNDEQAPIQPQTFTELKAGNVTSSSATFSVKCTTNTSSNAVGFIWSTSPQPVHGNSNSTSITAEKNSDIYTKTISSLLPNKRYYVRSFLLKPDATITYSDDISFTTPDATPQAPNSFFAKVNGTDFNPVTGINVTKMTLAGTTYITIAARKTNVETMGLVLNSSLTAGSTYNISQYGTEKVTYTPSASGSYVGVSGTIKILSHDLANKRIKGTFSCEIKNTNGSDTLPVTDGTFDISY